uniref:Anoxia-induced grl-like protein n=1 Tax=Haliotis discus discus TaxID=91233 RepID=D5FW84_HALDI|nr:anoxia-induced grl-like protein [Haliotis discus discus]
MKCVILACLLALVVAQHHFHPFRPQGYVDRHDGYSFEYHTRHYTFVVRSASKCYIMDVTDDQDEKLRHKDERYQIEDEVLRMIQNDQNLHSTTFLNLMLHHHDAILATECRAHDLYLIDFFPQAGSIN